MSEVGDRAVNRKRLTSLEIANAIAAAKEGASLDPRNAFWPQMLACLCHQGGNETEARQQWMRAASCDGWNDYQSVELMQLRSRIASNPRLRYPRQMPTCTISATRMRF